jgi:hypothetical protein
MLARWDFPLAAAARIAAAVLPVSPSSLVAGFEFLKQFKKFQYVVGR